MSDLSDRWDLSDSEDLSDGSDEGFVVGFGLAIPIVSYKYPYSGLDLSDGADRSDLTDKYEGHLIIYNVK